MSEAAEVEKPCIEYAKSLGFLHYKMDKGPGNKSWPDALFIGDNGLNMYVEFKYPGEEPRKKQHKKLQELANKGQIVHVVSDLDTFKKLTHFTIRMYDRLIS